MNIAIIDGDLQALAKACDAFYAELQALGLQYYGIETYSSGESFFKNKNNKDDYLVIISEIVLPDMNGIDLAGKIRADEPELPIIFFTYVNSYAMESYDVGASGYIQKPLTKEKLIAILRIVMKKTKSVSHQIILPDGQVISLNDVYYIKCINRRCMIYMQQELPHTCTLSMKQMTHILSIWDGFYQLATGLIVNFYMVKSIRSNTMLLKNGHYLPIAKGILQNVQEEYQKFLSK